MVIESLTSFVLTIVFGALLLLYFLQFHLSRRGWPKGPMPWPIVGNLWMFNNKEAYGKQFAKWRKDYGDPFTFYQGSIPTVVVNSWPLIYEATVTRKDDFNAKFVPESCKIFCPAGVNGISFYSGAPWAMMRKTGVSIVRKYLVSDELPLNISRSVSQALKEFPPDGIVFDPNILTSKIMMDIAYSNVIGAKENSMMQPDFIAIRECSLKMRDIFSKSSWNDYIPLYQKLFPFDKKKGEEAFQDILDLISKCFNEQESTYSEKATRTFTDALISMKKENETSGSPLANYLDDKSCCQLLFELLQGSGDTSSLGLHWVVYFLKEFPVVQEKMWNEINKQIGPTRVPVQDDKTSCPYSVAVLKEVLRCSMLANSGFLRTPSVDTQLGGFHIKKGTAVLLNYQGVTSDDEFWPEANIFKPERFLEDNETIGSKNPPTFLPFGTGKRNCFGERLAMMHLFLVCVTLMREYQFLPEMDNHQPRTDNKFELETQPVILFSIPKPFNIRVKRRK